MAIFSTFLDAFRAYLKAQEIQASPRELYEPVNYIMGLGGKRIRPLLVLCGHYLYDEDYRNALPLAYAAEVFHNFTLVHDDVMDDAPLRRGKPTVHALFDLNTAILSGDVMLIHSYSYLFQASGHPQFNTLLQVFNQTATEVCEGQQYDINFEERVDVTIPEYLRMIELKTAALLGGSLQIGALSGGADPEQAKMLAGFGRNLGIAFQLQDDLLDTFGDPGKFGKKTGGDIAQNKKTYLYLKALELAGPEQREELLITFRKNSDLKEQDRIIRVTEMFRSLGVREATRDMQLDYARKGYDQLDRLSAPPEKKQLLKQWAESLFVREE